MNKRRIQKLLRAGRVGRASRRAADSIASPIKGIGAKQNKVSTLFATHLLMRVESEIDTSALSSDV